MASKRVVRRWYCSTHVRQEDQCHCTRVWGKWKLLSRNLVISWDTSRLHYLARFNSLCRYAPSFPTGLNNDVCTITYLIITIAKQSSYLGGKGNNAQTVASGKGFHLGVYFEKVPPMSKTSYNPYTNYCLTDLISLT
jgi:hypothetical protein